MAQKKLFIAIAVLLVAAKTTTGWIFGKPGDKPEWDDFKATFLKYNNLPMTSDDAKDAGWTSTAVCQNDAYFNGNRYILNGDSAVMLLYDSNGKIAGIQTGVPKSKATDGFYKKDHWVEDGDMLVVTAYFVHPSVICNGTRKASKYLGDGLFIQTGKTPSSLMEIPLKQDDVKKTKWVEGKCVWGMGKHYWYDISNNMNCDNFFPMFLLYNGGKLNAFGFVMQGNFESSRYEHPPARVLDFFFQSHTQPICVKQLAAGGLSTVHIYLQHRPYFNHC